MVIISTLSNLLVHKLFASPVIISVNVIKIAGFHKVCNSTNELFVKLVPMPISNIVLAPFGHEAESTFPLMLKILAPIKAPASGAAGMHVFKANVPKAEPETK